MTLEGVMYMLTNSPRIKKKEGDDYVKESGGVG
jgi:hypothetical protein